MGSVTWNPKLVPSTGGAAMTAGRACDGRVRRLRSSGDGLESIDAAIDDSVELMMMVEPFLMLGRSSTCPLTIGVMAIWVTVPSLSPDRERAHAFLWSSRCTRRASSISCWRTAILLSWRWQMSTRTKPTHSNSKSVGNPL